MGRVGALLDVPVTHDSDGSPHVQGDGLLIYSLVPDELDKPVVQRISNLTPI